MTFKELYEISPVLNQIDVTKLNIDKDCAEIESFLHDRTDEMGMSNYSYSIDEPLVDHVLNAIAYCCACPEPENAVVKTLKWFLNDAKLRNRYNEHLDDMTDSIERYKYFTRSSIGRKFIQRVLNPAGIDRDVQKIVQVYFNSEHVTEYLHINTNDGEFVSNMFILRNDIVRGIISPYCQYIDDDGSLNRASNPHVAHDGCLSLCDENENYRKYAAIQAYYFLMEKPYIELMYRVLVDSNA